MQLRNKPDELRITRTKLRIKFLEYYDGCKNGIIKETKIRHFNMPKIELCKAED